MDGSSRSTATAATAAHHPPTAGHCNSDAIRENDGCFDPTAQKTRVITRSMLSMVVILLLWYIVPTGQPLTPSTVTTSSLTGLLQWKPLPDSAQVLTKIAFGSCNGQDMPQTHWDTLTRIYQPDLFLMAGDNVYGDCTEPTCRDLRAAYTDLARHPLVQSAAPRLSVYATLDDHDYGVNDGDATSMPYKETALQLFADFFGLDASELGQGAFRSRVWGGGRSNERRLQIILLDTRHGRSRLNATGRAAAPYAPLYDAKARMLSDAQWTWFEAQLNQPADLRIVVSSVQVLTDSSEYECWRQLPHEQERLFQLTAHKSVVFISGDVHVGGFYEYNHDGAKRVEVTSSSLTHSAPPPDHVHCTSPPDVCPVDATMETRRLGHAVHDNNFGTMDIDWMDRTFTVALRRTASSNGRAAGDVLQARTYAFPF